MTILGSEQRQRSLSGERAQHRARRARALHELADQLAKTQHRHPQAHLLAGELAPVMLDVHPARDDEQRLGAVRDMPAHRLHHQLGLACVGGACYERDRHARTIVAHAPDVARRKRAEA